MDVKFFVKGLLDEYESVFWLYMLRRATLGPNISLNKESAFLWQRLSRQIFSFDRLHRNDLSLPNSDALKYNFKEAATTMHFIYQYMLLYTNCNIRVYRKK